MSINLNLLFESDDNDDHDSPPMPVPVPPVQVQVPHVPPPEEENSRDHHIQWERVADGKAVHTFYFLMAFPLFFTQKYTVPTVMNMCSNMKCDV